MPHYIDNLTSAAVELRQLSILGIQQYRRPMSALEKAGPPVTVFIVLTAQSITPPSYLWLSIAPSGLY